MNAALANQMRYRHRADRKAARATPNIKSHPVQAGAHSLASSEEIVLVTFETAKLNRHAEHACVGIIFVSGASIMAPFQNHYHPYRLAMKCHLL